MAFRVVKKRMESDMNRRYPDAPLVGVGAIIFRADQVLLIQRGREPSLGRWSVPGGLVEVGESLLDAVKREVMEEVNLEVDVKDVVAVLDRVIKDEGGRVEYHYILVDFLCESVEGNPAPASDVLDCRFFPLNDLPRQSMTAGTEQVIHRAFNRGRVPAFPVYDARM
jgi:ADP-ribose pyrophosphatase YjhB (NUDIX family)